MISKISRLEVLLKACNTFRNFATCTASGLAVNLSNSIKYFGDYSIRVTQKAPVRCLDDLGTYVGANIRVYAHAQAPALTKFSINFCKLISPEDKRETPPFS